MTTQRTEWCVTNYVNDKLFGAVAGCGRNKGKWETAAKSRRTAQRWAKELRLKHPDGDYRVETIN